jgi:hypothetical protein
MRYSYHATIQGKHKLSLRIIKHHAIKILVLDTGWIRGISFTPQYPLYRRLGRPQSRSVPNREEKNFLPLPGIEPRFLGCPSRTLVDIPTELSVLPSLSY